MKNSFIWMSLALGFSSGLLAQSSVSNEEILRELKAIRQEIQEIRRELRQRTPEGLPADPINLKGEPSKGGQSTRVALIEYSDYQCPFCSRFSKETYPQLDADYIQPGKLKYVFRDLPLDIHKNAFKAAEAAHCAGEQDKFWEMHDWLFANQKKLAPEDLTAHAQALQLNAEAFQKCLDSGKYVAEIRRDMSEASQAGIEGTPTFLLGTINPDGTVRVTRKLVGAKPYAEFKAAIDALLASPK